MDPGSRKMPFEIRATWLPPDLGGRTALGLAWKFLSSSEDPHDDDDDDDDDDSGGRLDWRV